MVSVKDGKRLEMKREANYTNKDLNFTLDNISEISPIAHALSSELRLSILSALCKKSKNINELAKELDVPISTVALNVQVLIDAGILFAQSLPGKRGQMKICMRRVDNIHINLVTIPKRCEQTREIELPIGGYSLVGDVKPTCGMASENEAFELADDPLAFYHPNRFQAQIIWMSGGYVQYHFPKVGIKEADLEFLEFSFEICSEAPAHRNNWPSDIYVMVNGVELGTWRCPGDFGGRRGVLNPDWWSDINSQYGLLKTWKVDARGSWLENDYLSSITLKDLSLDKNDYISLRIGIKPDAKFQGGMNIFGKHFGDFQQDIIMRCGFNY